MLVQSHKLPQFARVLPVNEPLITLVRSAIAFFTLFIFSRLIGKQQISQLTFFEYVTGITIGSIASDLSISLDHRGLIPWLGLAMWSLLTILLQWSITKHRRFAKIIEGEPVVVIQSGKLLDDNIRVLRYRVDDIVVQLRQKGVFDISEVEVALIEPNGHLSVRRKSQLEPVTPKDLGLSTPYQGLPTELIVDGEIIEENLRQVGLDRAWLINSLTQRGITSPDQVSYASLNTQGKLYTSTYRNRPAGAISDVSDYPGSQ